VHAGSTVEFSARFLVSSHKHPFDDLFDRVLKWTPKAWSPTLAKVHPKNFRKAAGPVVLSTLKPIIQTPAFIRVQKVIPEQRKEWYGGRPFVVLHLALDTSRAGKYDGKVKLTLDRRKASLPITFTVEETTEAMPRLLIATTPYQAYSTDSGSNFSSMTKLLSSIPLSADYLNELPPRLEPYQVMLLADSVLAACFAWPPGKRKPTTVGGGAGTLSEICFAWMYKRLIIVLGAEGWAGQRLDERIRYKDLPDDRIYAAETPADAVKLLLSLLPAYSQKARLCKE
jgi:hypothetical protein